ncbi:fungal-specific transcription factor domain-containing protein [Colletotrichum falcatum]|nr:fungal-specific transcription factor domain-containing protein [Colletotrichum falcatum]
MSFIAKVLAPSHLTNPLTTTPSRFCTSASNGQPYFLGSSSNWSFSRQVLSVAHEHICQSPLPTDSLLFDGCAYDLGWNGSRTTQNLDSRSIPSYDYAIFLINAVKFHCGQMFHLFEEEEFMGNMKTFYSKSSTDKAEGDSLWYIHFLVVLAFGKSLVQRKNQGKRPAGAELFVRALQLLPDATALCKQPIASTELLCCMAWYHQALDFRHAAHNLMGQAKSVAMNHGMHTDMPEVDLGPGLVQRCRKIWWTVYVLDRQMTSLMGLPQSTLDEGVLCQLPSYPGSTRRTAALSMQIKFARIIAEISSSDVYGANGRLSKKFVLSTKTVLQSIVAMADELRNSFPLFADERFDESQSPWFEKSNDILEEIISSGNLIAKFRKNEMQQLEVMLVEFEATQPRVLSGFVTAPPGPSWQHTNTGPQTSVQAERDSLLGYRELSTEKSSQAEDLTAQQIIDVVNLLEWEDDEWMSLTMIEDGT